MFGPVITTEAHIAFWSARTLQQHCRNDCHDSALSVLGHHIMALWPGMSSRVFIMILSMLMVFVWGTVQARTHVQLALACQQSMTHAQHRLRLTMQHVYGHDGKLGNECADHAAALGTFGLLSSPGHNIATLRIHQNFDVSVCFEGCNKIIEVLERLQRIPTDAASLSPKWELASCSPSGSSCSLCISRSLLGFCFFFVLETIRTGTMRVIHITVKTEGTQRLRIKFALYCPTWIVNLKNKRAYYCRK